MSSLEPPKRGDSDLVHTIYHFLYIQCKKKITLNYPKSAATGFSKWTQERVQNSRSKRVINVRATEGLL